MVNNSNKRGAVCTWFGVPIRLSDLNYLIMGYTWAQLNISDLGLVAAKFFAGSIWPPNDDATQEAFNVGVRLGRGELLYYYGSKEYLTHIFNETKDKKNTTLWPNLVEPDKDNYKGSYDKVPKTFNEDKEFASPCFINPNFQLIKPQ